MAQDKEVHSEGTAPASTIVYTKEGSDAALDLLKTEVKAYTDSKFDTVELIKFVDVLPETGDTKYIYAVPQLERTIDGQLIVVLFIWRGSAWASVGALTSSVDLSEYLKKTEAATLYLPLSGGQINGNLSVKSSLKLMNSSGVQTLIINASDINYIGLNSKNLGAPYGWKILRNTAPGGTGSYSDAILWSSDKGVANGIATLDDNGKVPASQLPPVESGADITLSNVTEISDTSAAARKDLSNIPDNYDYIVDSYLGQDGSWFRQYKSGWLEQGGVMTAPANRISLLRGFDSAFYNVELLPVGISGSTDAVSARAFYVGAKQPACFDIDGNETVLRRWRAWGRVMPPEDIIDLPLDKDFTDTTGKQTIQNYQSYLSDRKIEMSVGYSFFGGNCSVVDKNFSNARIENYDSVLIGKFTNYHMQGDIYMNAPIPKFDGKYYDYSYSFFMTAGNTTIGWPGNILFNFGVNICHWYSDKYEVNVGLKYSSSYNVGAVAKYDFNQKNPKVLPNIFNRWINVQLYRMGTKTFVSFGGEVKELDINVAYGIERYAQCADMTATLVSGEAFHTGHVYENSFKMSNIKIMRGQYL